MQELPRLTIDLIKASCSDRSFERGEEYYRNGAIIRPIRHLSEEYPGVILTAECEGTSDQNYRVSAFLTENGISDADCSCPYDWGGYCKHIVALLLVYLNEKEKFSRDEEEALPDLEKIAAKLMVQGKENLVVLFLAMLKEEPSLIQLMRTYIACWEGYFSAKFLPDEIIKKSYLLFVELAFGRGFAQDEQQKEALEKLNAIFASAQEKAQQGDFHYAALILQALVFGCLSRYEDTQNQREIFAFVSECTSLLQVALKKIDLTKEKRQQWLLEMFECRNLIHRNLVFWENSVSDSLGKLSELILSVCKEEDVPILLSKAQLEKELLDRLHADREAIHCPFQRRNLIRFILRLYELAKRTSDYMKLAYSEGEGFLYVQKLCERKEIDKAYRYIQENPLNVDEYFPLAETLESLGRKDKVPLLMEMGLRRACEERSALVYTFAEYFLEEQNYKLAHSALVTAPLLAGGITKIRRLAKRLGSWAETREKLISQLLAQKNYELLTHIYLDDGEIENAIAALRKFLKKPTGKNARITSFHRNSLMRKVASEAEKSHPREAILILETLAETQIAKVDRRAYRRAFFYLEKIKHLYTSRKEEAKWRDYIAELRKQNAKKTAFLEEIREL